MILKSLTKKAQHICMATGHNYQELSAVASQLSATFREALESRLAPIREQVNQGNRAYSTLHVEFEKAKSKNRRLHAQELNLKIKFTISTIVLMGSLMHHLL